MQLYLQIKYRGRRDAPQASPNMRVAAAWGQSLSYFNFVWCKHSGEHTKTEFPFVGDTFVESVYRTMANWNTLPKNKRIGQNMANFYFKKGICHRPLALWFFGSVIFWQFFVNKKKACQQIWGAWRGQAFPGIKYHRIFIWTTKYLHVNGGKALLLEKPSSVQGSVFNYKEKTLECWCRAVFSFLMNFSDLVTRKWRCKWCKGLFFLKMGQSCHIGRKFCFKLSCLDNRFKYVART